jgi:CSLREA domain-containing protein
MNASRHPIFARVPDFSRRLASPLFRPGNGLLALVGLMILMAFSSVAQTTTVTLNCIHGGTLTIGNASEIFPPGPYTRMEVRLTTVPGVSFGKLYTGGIEGTMIEWGTVGANTFAPALSNPFNQNRVYSGQAFRYVNNGGGLGQSESIPVRFSNSTGFEAIDATLVINIIEPVGAPVILAQPRAMVGISPGTTATFTVVAEGVAPLQYQWYAGVPPNTAHPIAGANSSSFTTPDNLSLGQNHFWVRVRNAVSDAFSQGVTVNVGYLPVIDIGGPYTVDELQTVRLSVAITDADSTNHVAYWDTNDDDIFRSDFSIYGPEEGREVDFSAVNADGPATLRVRVRVSDNMDLTSEASTTVIVRNVAPVADFSFDGTGTLSFANVVDSTPDLAAGMRYSYDFDGDGVFEVIDTADASVSVPVEYRAGLVSSATSAIGRVKDHDGDFTDFSSYGGRAYVVTTASDEDDGTPLASRGTGTSLREAINDANLRSGKTAVVFSQDLFAGGNPVTITLASGQLSITNPAADLVVSGPDPRLLTISGNRSSRIFNAFESRLTLNRLTLANGGMVSSGGAVAGASIEAVDCVFADNSSGSWGGGVYFSGEATFRRCSFLRNSSASGGAVLNEGIGTYINCTFHGNTATRGGAIAGAFSSSLVRVFSSTVTGNSATASEGGIWFVGRPGILVNSIVSGNTAPESPNVSGSTSDYGADSNLIDRETGDIFLSETPSANGGFTPTLALKPNGIAVEAGDSSLSLYLSGVYPVTDQRGEARIIGTRMDIGAVEAIPGVPFSTPIPRFMADTFGRVEVAAQVPAGFPTSRRGVVFSPVAVNPFPTLGGPGVIATDTDATSETMWIRLSGLSPATEYALAAFAINEGGVSYSPVVTFQTLVLDSDGDTLSNAQEAEIGSNPFSIDTDGDGYNDATEVYRNFSPYSAMRNWEYPTGTHAERVLGYGPARGVDLQGRFIYAFSVGGSVAAGRIGSANFTTDNVPGVSITAGHREENWNMREFGDSPENDALESVFRSIRWSNSYEDDPELRTVKVVLGNLVPQQYYKLQLMFAESADYDRYFDIYVEGVKVADDFNPSRVQGQNQNMRTAAIFTHGVRPGTDTITIVLDGSDVALAGADSNPILSGVTLETITPPNAAPDTITRPDTTRVVKVLLADLMANDSDADGDPISILSVWGPEPAGATVAINGNFAVYTAPAANAGSGSFKYMLSDGYGGTVSTGEVTVTELVTSTNSMPVPDSPPNSASVAVAGEDIRLAFFGVPGRTYGVQYTTSIVQPYVWNELDPVVNVVAPADGVIRYTDHAPAGASRFYRAVLRRR